ncbi:MAG: extracellular solute-binding protein [Treponema sp.]|nr:extracellular solute-binding protein [Treponema sp.]
MKVRMLNKIIAIITLVSSATVISCNKDQGSEVPSAEKKELTFLLNSPELTEAYKECFAEYEKQTGVKITADILQNDYQTVLKTRINSGDIPDLFITSAYNDNKVFGDFSYNLENEPLMNNVQKAILASVTLDGHVTGYPFLVQSHSFVYNKALFSKAGITKLPETLSEYKDACEKLVAIGVQPFGTGFGEWWILPQTAYPSMSDAYNGDYEALFKDVESGKIKFGDIPQLDFVFDLLDLIKAYGGNKPMESTFDMQVSDFASGKVAIIHQGSWAEASVRAITPDIDIGYLKAPRKDGKGVIAVESNLTFRVYKDSKNRAEVLAFLEWLSKSDYGKNWIPGVIKQISPLVGAAAPDTQLAKETVTAQDSKITCPWWIFKGPDGIEQPFGTALQNYVAGTANRSETKEALSRLFADAYDAQ